MNLKLPDGISVEEFMLYLKELYYCSDGKFSCTHCPLYVKTRCIFIDSFPKDKVSIIKRWIENE